MPPKKNEAVQAPKSKDKIIPATYVSIRNDDETALIPDDPFFIDHSTPKKRDPRAKIDADDDTLLMDYMKVRGQVSKLADKYGVTTAQVKRAIDKSPYKEAFKDIDEDMTDRIIEYAVFNLIDQVKAGNHKAIAEVLNRKGKKRGWGSEKGGEGDRAEVDLLSGLQNRLKGVNK